MNLFNHLPGFSRTPAGKERLVLRALPGAWLWGTVLLGFPSLIVRVLAGADDAQRVMTTDIFAISLVILHWTVLLTVGIAAFIVMMMKGPAYVADAYPMPEAAHRDAPKTAMPHDR